MSYETLAYIRSHPDLYRLLRDDSSYYERIFQNNNAVYELEKIAKEKYKTRFVDWIERVGNKIELLSTFLDVFHD